MNSDSKTQDVWTDEEVQEIISRECCKEETPPHRCMDRGDAFVQRLKAKMNSEDWSSEVETVAYAAAMRGNGITTVLVFTGNEKKVKNLDRPAYSVIERLGHAAYYEASFDEMNLTRPVVSISKASPHCRSRVEEIGYDTYYDEYMKPLNKYVF